MKWTIRETGYDGPAEEDFEIGWHGGPGLGSDRYYVSEIDDDTPMGTERHEAVVFKNRNDKLVASDCQKWCCILVTRDLEKQIGT